MCQLLGVCSNKEVDIKFSLRGFKKRGKTNKHGWGFAYFENGNWKIIKKPSPLCDEDITQKEFWFRSRIIIGHVRLASCGSQIHENTHPFGIGGWVFAHNGTVEEIKTSADFYLKKFKPKGETDSEHAFCYLLEKIGDEKNLDAIKKILQTESKKIERLGNFNYLLSNGEVLFAYGDNSLYFVQRKAPFPIATLRDEEYRVNLGDIKAHDEKAILVATEPLTIDETWEKFSGLKIFKDGKEI